MQNSAQPYLFSALGDLPSLELRDPTKISKITKGPWADPALRGSRIGCWAQVNLFHGDMAKAVTDPMGYIQLFDEVYLHLKKISGLGTCVSNITFAADKKWSCQQICSSQEILNSLTLSDDLELNQILKSNLL